MDEQNGELMIVYYDTVDDTGRLMADIWMQSSIDNEATWSAPTKITTAATDETRSYCAK